MKRGQIFLIMTILVVTFMVSISTTLLEVQRSNYIDSTPDATLVLQAWKNTYQSIEQILTIELAQRSQGPSVNQAGINMTAQLGNLTNYLNSRGFSAIVADVGNSIDYTITGDFTTSSTVSITGSFFVHIQSGKVEIDNTFDITVTYGASINGINITVTKTINGELDFVTSCTITSSNGLFTYQDQLNGNYIQQNLVGGDTLTILTPNQIDIELQL